MTEIERALERFRPKPLTPEEAEAHRAEWQEEHERLLATYIPCIKCGVKHDPKSIINNKCPTCRKSEQIEAEDIKRAENNLKERLQSMTYVIPKRYIDNTFDDYKITPESEKAFNIIKRYAESETVLKNGNNIVLSGSVGTGKTMLAMCVLRERYLKYNSICYTTISEVITKARQSMSYGGDTSLMDSYYNSKYLVIDEIGRQSGSENELNILFEILNKRYNNVLPTVLITNKKSNEIEKYLGNAIIDRMKEVNTIFIDMSWSSYRNKA